jgi:predicted ester cyclase
MGIQGAIEHIRGIYVTYPDIHLTVDHQIAEGDWVATSYTMTGTHSGEWMKITPTGKKIKVTGVNLDRIQNDRIIEHGGAANLLPTFLEIGALIVNPSID